MSREKPNTYTAEFRESAVKLANESNLTVDAGVGAVGNDSAGTLFPSVTAPLFW